MGSSGSAGSSAGDGGGAAGGGGSGNAPLFGGMLFLDSPSTGTHYYKIGWQAENLSTGYINRSQNDADNYYNASFISTITLYEVKA